MNFFLIGVFIIILIILQYLHLLRNQKISYLEFILEYCYRGTVTVIKMNNNKFRYTNNIHKQTLVPFIVLYCVIIHFFPFVRVYIYSFKIGTIIMDKRQIHNFSSEFCKFITECTFDQFFLCVSLDITTTNEN